MPAGGIALTALLDDRRGRSTRSLLDLIRLEEALEELLGVNVDVISVGALLDRDTEIRRDAVPL